MNTKLLVGIVIAIIIGALIATAWFRSADDTTISLEELNAEPFEVTRPDVAPIPNTFSIMTPDEKAAAEEAARVAAETQLAASTTATSSATSTEEVQ
jgi:hypothetical protein